MRHNGNEQNQHTRKEKNNIDSTNKGEHMNEKHTESPFL